MIIKSSIWIQRDLNQTNMQTYLGSRVFYGILNFTITSCLLNLTHKTYQMTILSNLTQIWISEQINYGSMTIILVVFMVVLVWYFIFKVNLLQV